MSTFARNDSCEHTFCRKFFQGEGGAFLAQPKRSSWRPISNVRSKKRCSAQLSFKIVRGKWAFRLSAGSGIPWHTLVRMYGCEHVSSLDTVHQISIQPVKLLAEYIYIMYICSIVCCHVDGKYSSWQFNSWFFCEHRMNVQKKVI